VAVHVATFVAKFTQLGKYHTTDEALSGAERIGQGGVLLEDCTEGVEDVETLENCVDAIIPLDFSFS
jgi:hypothetical protein